MPNEDRAFRDFQRTIWEIFFALNLGGALALALFSLSSATLAFFSRLECRINIFLHVQQTDLVRGHLANWIPTVALALLLWLLLRTTSRTHLTAGFVRRAAGGLTMLTALVDPVCFYAMTSWPEWWRIGALVVFALSVGHDQRAAGGLEDEAEFLGDAATLAGEPEAHAGAGHLPRGIELHQFLGVGHLILEGLGRAVEPGFLEVRLVPEHRRGAEQLRQAVGFPLDGELLDAGLAIGAAFQQPPPPRPGSA